MLTLENLLLQTHAPASFGEGVVHLCNCSLFAKRLLVKDANLLDDLLRNHAKNYATTEMQNFLDAAQIVDEIGLKKALRQLRQRVILRIMFRDLNGLCGLDEVLETTTQLAEITIQTAVHINNAWLQTTVFSTNSHELSRASKNALANQDDIQNGFIVVGMGKLGGAELNVSSDIDLIFAFDEAPNWPLAISQQDFYNQLAKKVIAALDEITQDGFVFRVDMRLRPFGNEGVLVPSLDALEDYYQNNGREWERYAWIKGRVIYSNTDALEAQNTQHKVHALLRPFIFRKYLDYNAINSMRDLKLQIHRDVLQKGQVDNIKLGRGGIREIEFIAQVFQLMRGGRDTSLQIKPTLAVLNLLKNKGLLPEKTITDLTSAYGFLRNLEHRLMYVDDTQTQDLPKTDETKARIAKAMRFNNWGELLAQLNEHKNNVAQSFEATFSANNQTQIQNKTETARFTSEITLWQGLLEKEDALQACIYVGYSDAVQMLLQLQMLRSSNRYQQLPELSRQRFDALMPLVIQYAGQTQNADITLLRMINLLEAICRRASYLALLVEFPQALQLVIKLCAASPWLTQYLALHPILLDELLDTQTLYAVPNFAAMQLELRLKMADLGSDTEAQMDAMRHFKHAATLRFAAQDIANKVSLETLSDYFSALADLILQVAIDTIWQNFKIKHIEAPIFAIIAYGKLGGKELGYVSDLDIIFIYDDHCKNAAEDLSAIYARFAQRISSWFNTQTNAGLLYEIDLQLRPDGNSGLLVSSLEAFRDYQLDKAWVWEHQALTRARFVAGDAAIGKAFEAIRTEVLTQARDQEKLKIEVSQMREKMRASQKLKADYFDIKHSQGGIIDVEFIVQYLQLLFASKYPQLIENIGNIALLNKMGGLNIIDATVAKKAANAYRTYRQLIHSAKLQEKPATTELASVATHQACVIGLWNSVFNNDTK